jgi:hypothetical protein
MFAIVRSREAGKNAGVTGSKPKRADDLNHKDVKLVDIWGGRGERKYYYYY